MKTTGLLRSFAFLFCLGALAACDSSDNSTSPAPETPLRARRMTAPVPYWT